MPDRSDSDISTGMGLWRSSKLIPFPLLAYELLVLVATVIVRLLASRATVAMGGEMEKGGIKMHSIFCSNHGSANKTC